MRRQIQAAVLAVLILGAVVGGWYGAHYYTATIVPRAEEYRRTLTGLRPSEVQRVFLSTGSWESGRFVVSRRRQLDTQEVNALLPLINQATKWVPDYARGGWQCGLAIDTTTLIPHFEFEVYLTGNNGVLLGLHSDARGGWNYGTLRNDALGPMLEGMAAKSAQTP